jgi:hypothetical protein
VFQTTVDSLEKSMDDSEVKKMMKQFALDCGKDEQNAFLWVRKLTAKEFALTKDLNAALKSGDKIISV